MKPHHARPLRRALEVVVFVVVVVVVGLSACAAEDAAAAAPQATAVPAPDPTTGSDAAASEDSAAAPNIEHVDATAAAKRIANDATVVILDIRTPKEYSAGHLKGAVNIDFKADDFVTQLQELDTSKTYVVHCRTGGRSTNSLSDFTKLGFAHIVHLEGGIVAWEKAGNVVEK